MLPSDHRLAARKAIDPSALAGEPFINVSSTAPALRIVIDDCVQRTGLDVTLHHEADNLAMAISLVASTRGFALLPVYAKNFLPWSVVARPIKCGDSNDPFDGGVPQGKRRRDVEAFLVQAR